jgi:hypothetical protein
MDQVFLPVAFEQTARSEQHISFYKTAAYFLKRLSERNELLFFPRVKSVDSSYIFQLLKVI